ncbi:helix-turn-helix transcriptional regulator [Bradyrhizobium paxllaeri]|uniref:helix-turn-helix transcriptional regulator n=1 Tax=Bradyrhizobium paxllaeri TaxID=190148 RepID=UPI001651EF7E|nr:AlpA family phage regulatory protein [Bradyrhizobium paxllaeri]
MTKVAEKQPLVTEAEAPAAEVNVDGGRATGMQPRAMMTLEQILALIPVSRTTLFRMESEGRFPKGVYISGNRKIWFADEVIGWQNAVKLKGSRNRPPRGGGRPRSQN